MSDSNEKVTVFDIFCILHHNTAEEVLQDEEGLQTMRVLGNNMAWLLKCIEKGKEAGVAPVTEKKIWTNFVR